MNVGYIYIRSNIHWNVFNAVKLGKTINILDRETTYMTSEIKKGYYILVIEIDLDILDYIELELQSYLIEHHIYFNGGIEFYNKEIINLIVPYLQDNDINYKILSQDEINNLTKTKRINNTDLQPRDYQLTIINKSYDYFQTNNKGLLIIPCGVGKTLISLWITQKLNLNKIIIGVSNILLLKQWLSIVKILFINIPYLIVMSGISIENIKDFLQNNNKCFIITTYASSYKVLQASNDINYVFNMKINDECHHLTSINIQSSESTKNYIKMLNIKSTIQISLTATIKQLENINEDENIVSNDNIEYFGNIIERKCLLWSIDKKIVCDYIIQTIITNDNDLDFVFNKFNIIDDNDKRLFLSAFISLKSIFDNYSHHILLYSNSIENSIKLIEYIKILLENEYFLFPDLYYSNYTSDMSNHEQKKILDKYNKSKYGIITNVYSLGEGYDNHLIDAVVFAENMGSNIRIVQSSLRASRKNKLEPNKITKIILPILYKDDWLDNNDNQDLKKVKEVIYQMGLEDETIEQKIKVYKINIKKYKTKKKEIDETEDYIDEYDDELTKLIRLRTIKRTMLGTSYEKARKIIKNKDIKNKNSYYKLCEIDNRLTNDPEILYYGSFTNWINYLSIDRIYYDFEMCKNKVDEYLIIYSELKKNNLNLSIISNELCKIDKQFPPNDLWCDYYNIANLKDIIIITSKKKKNSIIL